MPEAQEHLTPSGGRWMFFFGGGTAEGDPARKDILGGKGASLAAMSAAGLPVPPGFTISVEACVYYHQHDNRWPDGLEGLLREYVSRLEQTAGKRFGDGANPLLVSVRSGSPVSMPGMMDTILNCGLSPDLAGQVADEGRFWQVYEQFVRQFARSVAGIGHDRFDSATAGKQGADAARACADVYRAETGKDFPATAWDALVQCVNAVFDSWNSRRAVVYRRSHDIRGVAGTAVNVQAMFDSQVSGIAFTANPSAPDAGEVIVEGSYGLGESVVSGDVAPDRFVLDRAGLSLKERAIGHKAHVVTGLSAGGGRSYDPDAPCLSDDEVLQVAKMSLDVENHFGFPVDIEWGLVDGKFALLQSRAIRGLDVAADVETGRLEEIQRLRLACGPTDKVWVMHNLAETLPAPTPLTWDIIGDFMSGDGGFGMMYRDFGYRPSRQVRRDGFLELICGRIFVDPDRAAGLFWENMPFEYDHREIVDNAAVLETAPARFNAERANGRFFLQLPGVLVGAIRSARTVRRARNAAAERFEREVLPGYLAYVAECRATDLSALPTEKVLAELHERIDRVLTDFGKESLKPGFFGGLAAAELEKLLVQLMGEEEGRKARLELTSGLAGDTTIEQNIMLYRVGQGEATLEEFLERFGHRAAGEMELSQPRWREDSSYIEGMVAQYRRGGATDPRAMHADKSGKRREAIARLDAKLSEWGGSFLLERIKALVEEAGQLLPYREAGKHYLMMGYEAIRLAIEDLARRWDLGRDVYFLTLDELERFADERRQLLEAIERRKLRWRSAQRLEVPCILESARLDELGRPRELVASTDLPAVPLASGVVTGKVRIARTPQDAAGAGDDCILVCPSTDPGWTAVFPSIRGLIVERGGVLSHGAITARDFGIPAVACPEATRLLAAGATVRLDGDRGRVQVIQEGDNG